MTVDREALKADILASLEAMELNNDRSPRGELALILREHGVPASTFGWRFWRDFDDLRTRWQACQIRRNEKLAAMILAGASGEEIVTAMDCDRTTIANMKRKLGLKMRRIVRWQELLPDIMKMLKKGMTTEEIAAVYDVTSQCMLQGMTRLKVKWPTFHSRAAQAARNEVRAKHGLAPWVSGKPGPKPKAKKKHEER
jgi:uncharacterized protein (DUF433 family)